jgi:ribosome-associated protein
VRGGQNVNKVSSKVIMSWNFMDSQGLSDAQKRRFAKFYANKINKNGQIVVNSDQYRDRALNFSACKRKLAEYVEQIWSAPKTRRPTKPSKGAVEKRLDQKKRKSEKKRQRKLLE